MMCQQSRNEAGYSLLEMLIVLAIIGLIGAVALPHVRRSSNDLPKHLARRTLYLAQLTRLTAIKNGRPEMLAIKIDENTVTSTATPDLFVVPSTARLSAVVGRNRQTTQHQGTIIFYPDGSSTGGEIHFNSRENVSTVIIYWLTGASALKEKDAAFP